MNGFVNSLLELILGWVRAIINDIWSMFGSGSKSLFSWLGKHWLALACVLIIGGITVDFIFYILRWNPQRVWYSKLDRILHRSEYKKEQLAFEEGYEAGIESFRLNEDPVISNYINMSPEPRLTQYDVSPLSSAANRTDESEEALLVRTRKRRSERHGKKSLRRRYSLSLPSLDEGASSRYGYPTPPVHAREAFHDAVYPAADNSAWENKHNDND